MMPTFLVVGLVLGVALHRRWRLLWAVILVTALAAGLAISSADGWSVAGAAGSFGVVLANSAIGAAVGIATRRVLHARPAGPGRGPGAG